MTTSPSSRGPTTGSASSIGNERTSVGLSLPRWSRLSSWIRAASTRSIAKWPSVTPAASSAASAARWKRGSSTSISITRVVEGRSGSARCAAAQIGRLPRGVLVVGRDDPLHELVPDNVLGLEADELDVVDVLEDLRHDQQTGALIALEVDLRDVAGHDHLRVEAEAREEHLHLLRRGVLGLVEDDEGVRERAAAHEGQRRDLDDTALQVLVHALGLEHRVERVEQRAQVRVDLRHHVAREEAQALAGLDGGTRQDDAVDLAP